MDKQLYHQEEKELTDFKKKIEEDHVFLDDIETFVNKYEDLLNETKVITKISDRLQKKLDTANQKIQSQNTQITKKNEELGVTIDKLTKARVGRKASTIILTVAIILFVSEEFYLEAVIEEYVNIPYLGLGIKLLIALILKFLESGLEGFYMNREKDKIIKDSGVTEGDRRLSKSTAFATNSN
ncbi:MAG: hypothetical protein RJQ09_18170 [Cyclobacteriaceae bacterium]